MKEGYLVFGSLADAKKGLTLLKDRKSGIGLPKPVKGGFEVAFSDTFQWEIDEVKTECTVVDSLVVSQQKAEMCEQ